MARTDRKILDHFGKLVEPYKTCFVTILQTSIDLQKKLAAARSKNASKSLLAPLVTDSVYAKKRLKLMLQLFMAFAKIKNYKERDADNNEEATALMQYLTTQKANRGEQAALTGGWHDALNRFISIGGTAVPAGLVDSQEALIIDLRKQLAMLRQQYHTATEQELLALVADMGTD